VNLLPWLLDWPPSRGAVVAFLVVTAFSAGTLALFGGVTDEAAGEDIAVESATLTVRLNDEITIPDTNGTVQDCVGSGVPGDRLLVSGELGLQVPNDRDRPPELVVSLAHTGESSASRIERTGRVDQEVFWLLEDDESLSVGDTAEVELEVRSGGSTVASTTRQVTVEAASRSYDC
jgi:hypothetical protein